MKTAPITHCRVGDAPHQEAIGESHHCHGGALKKQKIKTHLKKQDYVPTKR
jgi:hypothetical protein